MTKKLLAALCLLPLSACAGEGEETDLETAFCEILANGPEVDVAATESADGAPEAFMEDSAVEVGLVAGDPDFSGYVSFTTDESGSYAIGLSDDVPMEVMDADGASISLDQSIDGAACADLAVRHTVSLELGTYTLYFGPTELDEVSLVAEESDDDL